MIKYFLNIFIIISNQKMKLITPLLFAVCSFLFSSCDSSTQTQKLEKENQEKQEKIDEQTDQINRLEERLNRIENEKIDEQTNQIDRLEQRANRIENKQITEPSYNNEESSYSNYGNQYYFIVLEVTVTHNYSNNYSNDEQFYYTTQVNQLSNYNDNVKFRLLDDVVTQYKSSPHGMVNKGSISKRDIFLFNSYEEASKAREKYL